MFLLANSENKNKKQIMNKGNPIRLPADFSMEIYKPEMNYIVYFKL